MSNKTHFTAAAPCPVCRTGSKGCSVTADGLHICGIIRGGEEPGSEWKKLGENDGWGLYRPAGEPRSNREDKGSSPRVGKAAKASNPDQAEMPDWRALAQKFAANLAARPDLKKQLAEQLGLPVEALRAIPLIGYRSNSADLKTGSHTEFTFPEHNASGEITGLSTRWEPTPAKPDLPRKACVKGSGRGLTLPENWRDRDADPHSPLFIVEGPTDALAMAHAGFCCIGRPGSDFVRHLPELLADWPTDRPIIVMGENDERTNPETGKTLWPGRSGAEKVAQALANALARQIGIQFPPDGFKDMRAFLTDSQHGNGSWISRQQALKSGLSELETVSPAARASKASSADKPPTSQARLHAFVVGEPVIAKDRGNRGTVLDVLGNDRYLVHFQGKEGEAQVPFHASNLEPVNAQPASGKGGQPVGNPSLVAEFQPFPVEVLPKLLRQFVLDQAEAKDCDPSFVALPALSLIAASVGNSMEVQAKRGFKQPPVLWGVCVGDSGTGKSPGMAACLDIVKNIEAKAIEDYKRAIATYLSELKKAKARECEAADGESGEEVPLPQKPKREYFLVEDATIERIAEDLQTSPRGLLLVNDELANWFNSFGRYKGKSGGDDSPKWLSCHEANSLSHRRRTAPAGAPREIFVKRATIGICGGIQPGILAECLSNKRFIESGLTARLLFAYPPKRCPRFTDVGTDPLLESEFADVVNRLRELPCSEDSDPASIHLESEAFTMFKQFHNDGSEEAEGLDGGPMSAVIPKLNRIVLRLALTLYAFEKVATGQNPFSAGIDAGTMSNAVTLANWFKREAERVYAMLSERPEDRSARSLVEAVRRISKRLKYPDARIKVRDLQNNSGRKYDTAAKAELALDSLVTAGVADWVKEVANNHITVRWLVLKPRPTLSDTVSNNDEDSEAPSDTVSDTVFSNISETLEKAGNETQCRTVSVSDTDSKNENLDPKPPKKTFRSNPDRGRKAGMP